MYQKILKTILIPISFPLTSFAFCTTNNKNKAQKLISNLQDHFQQQNHRPIITDSDDLQFYAEDQHSYHKEHLPVGVIFPKNEQEVQTIVKLCDQFDIPIVPYSRGSSLEGATLSLTPSLVVSFEEMDQIVQFYPDDFQIKVQPGLQWMKLNEFLQPHGLFFPVDPGPQAGIGGMVATNCSGTNAFKYGAMRDHVVNLRVVKADGNVVQTAQRSKKSSAGYNLTQLMVGSEGTLGLFTEITLKLSPLPKFENVIIASFEQLPELCQTVYKIIHSGVQCRSVEMLDQKMVWCVNKMRNAGLPDSNLLMIKLDGMTQEETLSKSNQCLEILQKCQPLYIKHVHEPSEVISLWQIRKQSPLNARQAFPGCNVYHTDICVPISKLAENIKFAQNLIQQNNINGPIVGHAGDGNYHILFQIYGPETYEIAHNLNIKIVEHALSLEGTCSGEHGIGIGKRELLMKEKGEDVINLMKQIKKVFDPKGIMNPNKVFKL